jgi:hypothetical protein
MQASDATIEWSLLQNQFDSYEKYSLLIKLTSVLILAATLLCNGASPVMLGLLAILWLQDAIWKTFQSRIETRLLQLELFFADENAAKSELPYQFNSSYLQTRGDSISLIAEYLHQAIRPTVAFPHAFLLGLIIYTLC